MFGNYHIELSGILNGLFCSNTVNFAIEVSPTTTQNSFIVTGNIDVQQIAKIQMKNNA
jgi:hypothetical protein